MRRAFFFASLLPSLAGATSDIAVRNASTEYMPLALGQSGAMTISIANRGPDRADGVSIGTLAPFANFPGFDYTLQMVPRPGCGELQPGYSFLLPGFHFIAGPLAAGDSLECTIDVTRNFDAADSTSFGFSPLDSANDPNNGASFYLGTLTDVALSVAPVTFVIDDGGVAHAVVRLSASNRGDVDIAPFVVGGCTDSEQLPFALSGNLSGGCGPSVGFGCFDYGFGFRFPALGAHQSYSCELALDGLGKFNGPLGYYSPEAIDGDLFDAASHGTVIDTDRSNDAIALILGGEPAAATPALAASARSAIVFGTLLIGLSALASRQRARRRVRAAAAASLEPKPDDLRQR